MHLALGSRDVWEEVHVRPVLRFCVIARELMAADAMGAPLEHQLGRAVGQPRWRCVATPLPPSMITMLPTWAQEPLRCGAPGGATMVHSKYMSRALRGSFLP